MGSEKGQRKVRLTIEEMPGISGTFGCHIPFGFGSLEPLPYWGTSDTSGIYLWYSKSYGRTYFQTPTGVSEVVTVFVEGYSTSLRNGEVVTEDLYDMRNSVGSAVYLTFDPPRRVLGPKDTQTDLRIGYYVEEEDPWEAQNAEQGTVNNRDRVTPSLRHPRVLRRTQQRDGLHSYPTTGYHSNRGVLRALLNIHSIQRCSGSLLVSYRRASYA